MKQDWENIRIIWNKEWHRIGQKELAEIVTPDAKPKSFNHSYVSKLGRGTNQFTEEILEKFSVHMNLSLVDLFNADLKLQEDEFMKEIQECLDLMVSIPEFKRAILSKCDELKIVFKDKVSTVKKKSTGLASTTLGRSE